MKRVQKQRGVRLPPDTVYVGRPSPWGNPWRIDKVGTDPAGAPWTRDDVIRWFAEYARNRVEDEPGWLEPLRGHDLACYCPSTVRCHADVLLELLA